MQDNRTKHGRSICGPLIAAAAAAAIFACLAWAATHGRWQQWDEQTLLTLRRADQPTVPAGPAWIAPAAQIVTLFGGSPVVFCVVAFALALLLRRGRGAEAVQLLAAALLALILSETFKHLFGRPRPTCVPHLELVTSPSFPSGHAMLSAAAYATLATIAAGLLKSRAARAAILAGSVLLVTAIGFTRMVLGVHYPTDVLAGWAGGVAWACICWAIRGAATSRRQ